MNRITTHVLDLARGGPVAGLAVELARRGSGGEWEPVAEAATDGDGRVRDWAGAPEPMPGHYRLRFATGPHLASQGAGAFYPEVSVVFSVAVAGEHHHVPLLLGPYGYTTYRGT